MSPIQQRALSIEHMLHELHSISLCAEPPPSTASSTSEVKVIVPVVVAIAAAVALAALAGYLVWRTRQKEPVSTALSRAALLKLSSSTMHDLEFEFQKGGLPVLIGKGGFGRGRDYSYCILLAAKCAAVQHDYAAAPSSPAEH